MKNQKSVLRLLTTTALVLTSGVSLAQNSDWKQDCWFYDNGEVECFGDNGEPILEPTQQQATANNDNMAQEALDAHNRYRAAVGVPALQWSQTLTNSAQQWADRLAATNTFQHSSNLQGVGENLWRGTAGAFTTTQMVDSWGSEQQFFTPGVFPNVSTTGNWSAVGHYTQTIWRNTTDVGCAVATASGNDIFVCHYSPAGNVRDRTVY